MPDPQLTAAVVVQHYREQYETIAKKLTEYSLTLAGLKLDGRVELYAPVYVSVSASYQESWIGVYAGSELARADPAAHQHRVAEGGQREHQVPLERAQRADRCARECHRPNLKQPFPG